MRTKETILKNNTKTKFYILKKGKWIKIGKDNADTNTRYACEKHKVEVENNWEGREVVRKILD